MGTHTCQQREEPVKDATHEVPGWSAKPLVSAHDRIMGTHTNYGHPQGSCELQQMDVMGRLMFAYSWKALTSRGMTPIGGL